MSVPSEAPMVNNPLWVVMSSAIINILPFVMGQHMHQPLSVFNQCQNWTCLRIWIFLHTLSPHWLTVCIASTITIHTAHSTLQLIEKNNLDISHTNNLESKLQNNTNISYLKFLSVKVLSYIIHIQPKIKHVLKRSVLNLILLHQNLSEWLGFFDYSWAEVKFFFFLKKDQE